MIEDGKIEVSEETKEAVGKTPASIQMRVLRSQLEKMKPDDEGLPKLATKLMALEKQQERKRLEKRLSELDDDDYDMGMMW